MHLDPLSPHGLHSVHTGGSVSLRVTSRALPFPWEASSPVFPDFTFWRLKSDSPRSHLTQPSPSRVPRTDGHFPTQLGVPARVKSAGSAPVLPSPRPWSFRELPRDRVARAWPHLPYLTPARPAASQPPPTGAPALPLAPRAACLLRSVPEAGLAGEAAVPAARAQRGAPIVAGMAPRAGVHVSSGATAAVNLATRSCGPASVM